MRRFAFSMLLYGHRAACMRRAAAAAPSAAAAAASSLHAPAAHWRGANDAPFCGAFQQPRRIHGSAVVTAAVPQGGEAAPVDDISAEAAATPSTAELLRFLQGKLPQYCCGCGVRLQQAEEDQPG